MNEAELEGILVWNLEPRDTDFWSNSYDCFCCHPSVCSALDSLSIVEIHFDGLLFNILIK